jgi:hypothetical protein
MAPAQIASFNSRQPRRYVPYGALWRLAKKHSLRRWRREHAGRTTAHAPKYEQANAPTRASRRAASTPSAARRMSPNAQRKPAKDRRFGKSGTVLDFTLTRAAPAAVSPGAAQAVTTDRERRRLSSAPAPPRLSPPIMPVMPDVRARSEAIGVAWWSVIRGGVCVIGRSIAVGIVRRGERGTDQGAGGKPKAHATPAPSMPPMSATPTSVPPLDCFYGRS